MPEQTITEWMPIVRFFRQDGDIFPKGFMPRSDYFPLKQWTVSDKQWYIDSVFRNYDVLPPIKLCTPSSDSSQYVIQKGWNRIKTIGDFFNSEFPLPCTLRNVQGFTNYVPLDCIDDFDASVMPVGFFNVLPAPLQQYIRNITVKVEITIGNISVVSQAKVSL